MLDSQRIQLDVHLCRDCQTCALACSLYHEAECNLGLARLLVVKDMASYTFNIVICQHQHMLIDSLPLCDFAFPQLIRAMDSYEEWQTTEDISGDLDLDVRLLEAVTGMPFTREELDMIAERAFTLERAMLARAGRGRPLEETLATHFRLPCRADGTLIDETGYSRLLDEYYAARGWDSTLGWPQDAVLGALGLEEISTELDAYRRAALRPS